MTDLNLHVTASADGRQASAELRKLAGDIATTKVAMLEAQAASKAAAAALKEHARATNADAAETKRLHDALVAARTEEALATRKHALSGAAMSAHDRAIQGLTTSAGQARASMASLGQQVGDVAQGIAVGTSAFTLLAQQGGQVAFAMSGMGGTLGRVGAAMSGPVGAAALGLVVVLGSLWSATRRADEAQAELAASQDKTKSAAERLRDAVKELNELQGVTRQTAEESARATLAEADALIEKEKQERRNIKVLLERLDLEGKLATKFVAPSGAAATQGGQIGRGARQASLTDRLAEQDRKIAEAESQRGGAARNVQAFEIGRRVAAALDPAVKASRALETAQASLFQQFNQGKISASQYETQLRAAEERYKTTTQAIRSAAGQSNDLTAENRRLAEAFNPLLAAQQDYKKNLDDIAKAEARGIISAQAAAAFRRDAVPALLATSAQRPAGALRITDAGLSLPAITARELDDLGDQVGAQLRGVSAGIAEDLARGFAFSVGNLSQAIGGSIGQGLQRNLQRAGGIADVLNDINPGQGDAFFKAFAEAGREAFRPVTDLLKNIFKGDGELAKMLGNVVGTAALGADVGGLFQSLGLTRKGKNFAKEGGAVGAVAGSLIAGPAGALIGATIGSLAGGAIRPKNNFADARLTSNARGADATIFNSRGGAGSISSAQGLAGSVGDALSTIAQALGGSVRAGVDLGAIGFSGDQFFFNRTGGDFKAAGNERFGTSEEAVAAAVANALASGAITTSPRVQAALQRYAGNVNTAVAEALKIRDLEQLLEAQGNPFIAAFRDFERQARQRVDVAREYGFDLIEIEKLNADQRAALVRDTLQGATSSARALLDEFRFGDRAGGSIRDQLGTLGGERDRLAGLVRGGDAGQLDALANVIRQIDDLQREAFGSTGEAASGRASSAALLQELVDATEARVRAASEEARRAQAEQTAALKSADATLEDIFKTSREQLAALNAIAAGFAPGGGGGGIYGFGLAESAGR